MLDIILLDFRTTSLCFHEITHKSDKMEFNVQFEHTPEIEPANQFFLCRTTVTVKPSITTITNETIEPLLVASFEAKFQNNEDDIFSFDYTGETMKQMLPSMQATISSITAILGDSVKLPNPFIRAIRSKAGDDSRYRAQ